ncbi:hypothetical protein GGF32_009193 [Allomyces javanicus]|nr:hypothetical protein GGF32_009193 [Allomyces javanicus]
MLSPAATATDPPTSPPLLSSTFPPRRPSMAPRRPSIMYGGPGGIGGDFFPDAAQEEVDHLATLLQETRDANSALVENNEYLQRKLAQQATEASKLTSTVARLEQALFKAQAQIDDLARDKAQLTATRRQLERKLDSEVSLLDDERLTWVQREEEMAELRKALQAVGRSSPPSSTNVNGNGAGGGTGSDAASIASGSANGNGDDAAGDDAQDQQQDGRMLGTKTARDIKKATRTIKWQEALIKDLRAEILELSNTLDSANNQNNQLKDRVVDLSNELMQLTEINQTLQEENEAFQMLISEHTMSGDFFLHMPNPSTMPSVPHSRRPSMLPPVSEVPERDDPYGPAGHRGSLFGASPNTSDSNGGVGSSPPPSGTSLADEIHAPQEEIRKLTAENKALNLYIQKILGRILAHPELQTLLAHDYTPSDAAAAAAAAAATSPPPTPPRRAPTRRIVENKRASKRFSWISLPLLSAALQPSRTSSLAAHAEAAHPAPPPPPPPSAVEPTFADAAAKRSVPDEDVHVDVPSPLPNRPLPPLPTSSRGPSSRTSSTSSSRSSSRIKSWIH